MSGLDLSAAFHVDAVAPVMRTHLPDVQYTAARIGRGSDVLGHDDARSTDHFWGPLLHPGHLRHMQAVQAPPVNYGLLLTTVPRYFRGILAWTQCRV